ncbi:polyphosphate polymerase domain-containing protein [Candidatus Sulfidibacterium hydrothermale]|uniref:polyphosphate polymerase domain-containing protein n=1 Tax=Candidatus Sulfidibacterium hydrothermale TaxID=2875962 RepID=UPI001F0A4E13|nr:polyphosphate polymerase domain-containing protein [Candidatus Sulfidibacterium hydrothermale]UBM63279.1 polyphosphate polymerase domain-containing protein [Candidatus Sulfidibacterium hydrothermale]
MFFPEFDLKNSRYERKYLISDMQRAAVQQQIRLHPASFSPIFYPRYINNIYLDTAGLDAFYENLAGHGKRKKARIRWYGDMMGKVSKPVLEFKIKEGMLGNKLLFPLQPFEMDENFNAEMLRDVFLHSSLPDWALESVLKQKPSLVNRYKRTYYATFDGKFRLTLDEELSYFAVGPAPNYFLEKYVSRDLVVELKYAYADYREAVSIADFLPFRLTKSSKYVTGIGMIFSIPV